MKTLLAILACGLVLSVGWNIHQCRFQDQVRAPEETRAITSHWYVVTSGSNRQEFVIRDDSLADFNASLRAQGLTAVPSVRVQVYGPDNNKPFDYVVSDSEMADFTAKCRARSLVWLTQRDPIIFEAHPKR